MGEGMSEHLPKCDNCEAPMDEDDRVVHCPATACTQAYCRHCVPVWCDWCGRLIGPDPTQATPTPPIGGKDKQ